MATCPVSQQELRDSGGCREYMTCGMWGEPSRSRAEAAPKVQWSRGDRSGSDCSLLCFRQPSVQLHNLLSLFFLSPTPAPVTWLLCLYSIVYRYKRVMSDRYTQIVEEIPPPPSTSDQGSARPSPTTHSSVTHPLCSNLVVTLDHPDPLRFIQTHSTSAGRGRPLTSRSGQDD